MPVSPSPSGDNRNRLQTSPNVPKLQPMENHGDRVQSLRKYPHDVFSSKSVLVRVLQTNRSFQCPLPGVPRLLRHPVLSVPWVYVLAIIGSLYRLCPGPGMLFPPHPLSAHLQLHFLREFSPTFLSRWSVPIMCFQDTYHCVIFGALNF